MEAASVPVMPSIPSMKLNRFTNQTQTSAAATGSQAKGRSPWNTKAPSGRTLRPTAAAAKWAASRHSGESPPRSSRHDTTASTKAAPTTAKIGAGRPERVSAITTQAGSSTARTASPPPRGVGTA
jgi:hypothetical protein